MVHGAILIVEPDASIAALISLILSDEGYLVERACSALDALNLLTVRGRDAFPIVLSSPCVQSLSAPYAWLDCLRAQTSAEIVICTRGPAAHYADFQARGFAAVLEEPFDLQDLIDVVTRASHRRDIGGSVLVHTGSCCRCRAARGAGRPALPSPTMLKGADRETINEPLRDESTFVGALAPY